MLCLSLPVCLTPGLGGRRVCGEVPEFPAPGPGPGSVPSLDHPPSSPSAPISSNNANMSQEGKANICLPRQKSLLPARQETGSECAGRLGSGPREQWLPPAEGKGPASAAAGAGAAGSPPLPAWPPWRKFSLSSLPAERGALARGGAGRWVGGSRGLGIPSPPGEQPRVLGDGAPRLATSPQPNPTQSTSSEGAPRLSLQPHSLLCGWGWGSLRAAQPLATLCPVHMQPL